MEHAPDSVRQRATRTIVLCAPMANRTGRSRGGWAPRASVMLIKSFVFLDDFDITPSGYTSFRMHPHSGIATITVLPNGDLRDAGTTGGLPNPILGYIGSMTLELAASVLLGDRNPMFHFLKNLAMSAGLFQGRTFGAGAYSFDNREKASDIAIALAQ